MTENHPITPPEEVIDEWESEWHHHQGKDTYEMFMAKQAARWGADQELLACGNYLEKCAAWEPEDVTELYNYRRPRPKPPSLKEQALEAVDALEGFKGVGIIRRALESLPE